MTAISDHDVQPAAEAIAANRHGVICGRPPIRSPYRVLIRFAAHECVVLLISGLALLPATGCRNRTEKFKPLWTDKQAERLLIKALEGAAPDERRRAVERVAGSKFVTGPMAVETMGLIVRTDDSQNVRRAAARCLGRSRSGEALKPLVQVLEAAAHPREVRPASSSLERASMEALNELYSDGLAYHPEEELVDILVRKLGSEDRDVRISAARMLGNLRCPSAVHALIDTLRTNEFILAYEAEQSLVRLTGETHRRNHAEWLDWLEEAPDSLAQVGQAP